MQQKNKINKLRENLVNKMIEENKSKNKAQTLHELLMQKTTKCMRLNHFSSFESSHTHTVVLEYIK